MLKPKYTKKQIIDTALLIANELGFNAVTMRAVAKSLDTSVLPLYSVFTNNAELHKALAERIGDNFHETMNATIVGDPFLNLGAGMLKFALDNPKVFVDLRLNEEFKKFFEPRSIPREMLVEIYTTSKSLRGISIEQLPEIISVMTYVTDGIILEHISEKKNLSFEELVARLKIVSSYFIEGFRPTNRNRQSE